MEDARQPINSIVAYLTMSAVEGHRGKA